MPAADGPENLSKGKKGKPALSDPMDSARPDFQKADWSNKGVFNCDFQPDNVSFSGGKMVITLDTKGCPSGCDGFPYASGEYRSDKYFSYGYYETSMVAAKGPGIVGGTFFTYTGSWGTESHDEIDIEFIGPSAQLQLNYYTKGKGGHEKIIELPFDPTEGFHSYGFMWTKDYIEWYVDGKPVHKATKDIPTRPGQLMMNYWAGTQEVTGWLGGVYKGSGGTVKFDYVEFIPQANVIGASEEKAQGTEKPVSPQTAKTNVPDNSAPEVKTHDAKPAGPVLDLLSGKYRWNGFNGAVVNASSGALSLKISNKNDAGITVDLGRKYSGRLEIDYSGTFSGGWRNGSFTVLAIDFDGSDNVLIEKSYKPSKEKKTLTIDVNGVNKINIMGIGQCNADLDLSSIRFLAKR